MTKRSLNAILAILVFVPLVRAQSDPSRVEVFGGYSLLNPDIPGSAFSSGAEGQSIESVGEFVLGNVLGWTGEVAVNLNDWLGITANVAGYYKGIDVTFEGERVDGSASLHTFLFGPRATLSRGRVEPFVHAMFGFGRVEASGGLNGSTNRFDETGFAGAIGGGVDVTVNPNVSVRAIEIDYFPYRNATGEVFTFNNVRWGSGVVFRF